MTHWITQPLADQIRSLFEPKYDRKLTDQEIIDIANNLTKTMKLIIGNKIENGV